MFKKILITVTFLFTLIFCWQVNSKPVFEKYASTFEIYQGKNGSCCNIVTTDKTGYAFNFFKTGESCTVDKSVKPNTVLKDFDARIVKIEKIEQGVSIYAYSEKLKNYVVINGKKVNLHIFNGDNVNKIGTPLIFGGF